MVSLNLTSGFEPTSLYWRCPPQHECTVDGCENLVTKFFIRAIPAVYVEERQKHYTGKKTNTAYQTAELQVLVLESSWHWSAASWFYELSSSVELPLPQQRDASVLKFMHRNAKSSPLHSSTSGPSLFVRSPSGSRGQQSSECGEFTMTKHGMRKCARFLSEVTIGFDCSD